MDSFSVSVQENDFDVAQEQRSLLLGDTQEGAISTFTGYVRSADKQARQIEAMELEHYPGMTEKSLMDIMEKAQERWPILAGRIVHRIGRLEPGDQIVWVGVSSSHRDAAHNACEYIMDFLKTEAPFWKKEVGPAGEQWVDARESDRDRSKRWN
jgi:molybdopterin synthase catalytic subunit